jgi:hypothetical protein
MAAVLCEVDAEYVPTDVSAKGSPPQWKPARDEWRRYRPRTPKKRSNGSEVAPDKCHKLNGARHPSVPHSQLAKVPDLTPLSISRGSAR